MDPYRLIHQVLNDTYRIDRLIGQGGMGAVYEASHLGNGQRYAVKLLSPSLVHAPLDQVVARFWREAEITSKLNHPHIVQCMDTGHTPAGDLFIIMEFLEGEDLQRRLARVSRFQLEQAAPIIEQAASALQLAHESGIIHRDLKPSNIYLCSTEDGSGDVVKILDFGLSKVIASHAQLTTPDTVMGTPHYMSPEQVVGPVSVVTLESDVFSLGVIAFEMMAGQPPFDEADVFQLMQKIVNDEPPSFRSFGVEIPEAVEQVVMKAMSKQPGERYSSMEEFWLAFASAIDRTQVSRTGNEETVVLAALPTGLRQRTGPKTLPPLRPEPTTVDPPTSMIETPASTEQSAQWIETKTQPLEPLQPKPTVPDTVEVVFSVGTAAPLAGQDTTVEARAPTSTRRWLLTGAALFLIFTAAAFALFRGRNNRTERQTAPIVRASSKPAGSARPLSRRTGILKAVAVAPPDRGVLVVGDEPKRDEAAVTPSSKPRRKPRSRPEKNAILQVLTKSGLHKLSVGLFLDGKKVGETPFYRTNVDAGFHIVEVRESGYKRVRRRIRLKPHHSTSVVLELSK